MSISNDLFIALLAMDTYNRGYNPGLTIASSQIGLAALGFNSSILDQTPDQGRDVSASFFAQSYSLGGKTIIAYRGTDSPIADAASGYGIGGGTLPTAAVAVQGRLALEFYNAIKTAGASNIELTGDGSRLLQRRGHIEQTDDGRAVLITLHPSYILRMPDASNRAEAEVWLISDIRKALDWAAA
jgi:hypothetical protein